MRHLIFLITVICLITSPAIAGDFAARLTASAHARIGKTVLYDPSYVRLSYPEGDVPDDRGVCTDVVVRAYRGAGIDLQKRVHEDMARHFSAYPRRWGLKRTDRNIDHRRVPNLRVFFKRHGQSLPVTANAADYKPGDVVTWDLKGTRCCGFARLAHMGIISDKRSSDGKRPLVVHNIGAGTRLEDMLFTYTITGHYRYTGH